MNTRRKVFVINTTAATGGNLIVSTNLVNSPAPFNTNVIVESGKLLFGFNKAGFVASAIASSAEVVQVLALTVTNVVPDQKYTLIREANPMAMIGRDANGYQNTKKYTWHAPTVITDQAIAKAAMITALTAKVNADTTNFATASTTDLGVANLTITEAAGYGLLPSYPGPASWMLVGAGTEITHALTAGKPAVGNGNVMLANRAQWTLDGVYIKSGLECFNFDKTLPVAGTVYTTIIINEKYGMTDHDGIVPVKNSDIILYVAETTIANVTALKTALGIA